MKEDDPTKEEQTSQAMAVGRPKLCHPAYAVLLCVVSALGCVTACVAFAVRDAEHRSQYAAAVETIEYLRREMPNMDAAVQHHEDELERLRRAVKALEEQVATLQGTR